MEQTRKLVESTLRESQEENDDLRRKILGLETQLKEYLHFADSWQDVETRLKEKIFKLEVLKGEVKFSHLLVNFSVSSLSRVERVPSVGPDLRRGSLP